MLTINRSVSLRYIRPPVVNIRLQHPRPNLLFHFCSYPIALAKNRANIALVVSGIHYSGFAFHVEKEIVT